MAVMLADKVSSDEQISEDVQQVIDVARDIQGSRKFSDVENANILAGRLADVGDESKWVTYESVEDYFKELDAIDAAIDRGESWENL